MRIGKEIRRRRKALDWTLEDLAHRSGLSPRYISTLENDKRDPSLSTIDAVAKALGADPGELLGAKGVPPGVLEAARLLHGLPTESQEAVLRLMRLLGRRRRSRAPQSHDETSAVASSIDFIVNATSFAVATTPMNTWAPSATTRSTSFTGSRGPVLAAILRSTRPSLANANGAVHTLRPPLTARSRHAGHRRTGSLRETPSERYRP